MITRQAALAAGKKWYDPTVPCAFGHLAPRRVDNGRCSQCDQETNERKAAARKINQPRLDALFPPDMVITRGDAIRAGFKLYRTGEPCAAGHRGWRYVTTRGCITCKEGK